MACSSVIRLWTNAWAEFVPHFLCSDQDIARPSAPTPWPESTHVALDRGLGRDLRHLVGLVDAASDELSDELSDNHRVRRWTLADSQGWAPAGSTSSSPWSPQRLGCFGTKGSPLLGGLLPGTVARTLQTHAGLLRGPTPLNRPSAARTSTASLRRGASATLALVTAPSTA